MFVLLFQWTASDPVGRMTTTISAARPNCSSVSGAEIAEETMCTPQASQMRLVILIECQFGALRSFALNGSDYPSHADQDAAIRAYLRWHNRNARPAKPWRLNAEIHHSLPDVAA